MSREKEAPELWVPAERVLRIADKTRRPLHSLSQGAQRKLSRLRAGEQAFVSLTATDKLFIELGVEEWLHYRKEDGGLADIYEDGEQYGKPARNNHIRYGTPAERLEARRETWRHGKRERALRNGQVEVPCVKCRQPRLVHPDYAKEAEKRRCMRCRAEEMREDLLRLREERQAA